MRIKLQFVLVTDEFRRVKHTKYLSFFITTYYHTAISYLKYNADQKYNQSTLNTVIDHGAGGSQGWKLRGR